MPITFEKDLSFQPIENPNPRHLTPEQIDFYNREGYLKPFRVFDDLQTIANRAYFDWLLAKITAMRDGRNAYAINGFHTKAQSIWDIVTHPPILDYVEDLLGPNFVCWGTHFFCKLAGDPAAVPMHQDASYWPFDHSRTVTVWLAIDDADIENAAMQFIPRTHTRGALPWKQTQRAAVLNQEIENIQALGEPVYDELRAGEMSLHADMLAHGSDPNSSNRRRCGLTIRYCPVEVRALNDDPVEKRGWNRKAILVRGQDPSGHWSNYSRPVGEDFSPMEWQINSG
ncbi:hypothetical protein IAD21_00159 [Abditibacteriota bacterium]|nr:hypothetical protein IAD21_00159 [Abditibacteriota bacterium]